MYIQIIIFRNNEIFCHKERIDQKMFDGQCVYGDWIAGRDIACLLYTSDAADE